MIVILEGPDGSGKTTLADNIRNSAETYVHLIRSNSKPPRAADIFLYTQWLDRFPKGMGLIVDRHPLISEYVYGPILRDKCLHNFSLETIRNFLEDQLIVYCRPSFRAVIDNVLKGEHRIGVDKQAGELIQKYDEVMAELKNLGANILLHNYEHNPGETLQGINNHLKQDTENA